MEETTEMNDIYTTELLGLGVTLTEMAVKGTATKVSNKIRAIKEEKNVEKYEIHMMKLLMNCLMNAKRQFVLLKRIKQIEKVVISDDDIQHLHNTVSRILEIIKESQIASVKSMGDEAVENVKKTGCILMNRLKSQLV